MRKDSKISKFPRPTNFDVLAFVCYNCDQYFFVDRGPLVRRITCPACQGRVRGYVNEATVEYIGRGKIEYLAD